MTLEGAMFTLCVGLFSDRHDVDAATDELGRLGLSAEDIGLVLTPRGGAGRLRAWEHQNHIDTQSGDDWRFEDLKRIGGAWLAFEVGSLTLPIAGYLLALGGLVAGLAGAAAALLQTTQRRHLADALIDVGMDEKEARYHEKRVAQGAFLVVVNCSRCEPQSVRDVLLRHGAEDRTPRLYQAAPNGPTGTEFSMTA